MIIGAIEAGGTKFVCGLFEIHTSSPGAFLPSGRVTGGALPSGLTPQRAFPELPRADKSPAGGLVVQEEPSSPHLPGKVRPFLIAKTSIPTTEPGQTIAECIHWFESSGHTMAAMGIGSFGPVDIDPESPGWGCVTSTPKPYWRGAALAPAFRDHFGIAVGFDTDVNAAVLGEATWGAAMGMRDAVYITVGTGIGGGVLSGGHLVHGRVHPELGHIRIGRIAGDEYPGYCPFHRDCLEGLASGPAIGARWGTPAKNLPEDHPAWELEASYLARACAAFTLTLSPHVILIGGGVGMRPGLVERIEALCKAELAGYLAGLEPDTPYQGYIRRPGLGHEAGLYGAAALALTA